VDLFNIAEAKRKKEADEAVRLFRVVDSNSLKEAIAETNK
jgi:hypothetical protein